MPVTGAANGARALVKGHYRLIDHATARDAGNMLARERICG